MEFIDNIKGLLTHSQEAPYVEKYGKDKAWFLSPAGRKVLDETRTTVELTDYIARYLECTIANKNLLVGEDLYRFAFVLADSVINSKQSYAGKENVLNEDLNPFIAYLQRMKRNLSHKNLCYEMLLILFGAVDPFNPNEWIYDNHRGGFSEEEYQAKAEEIGINFTQLLSNDYTGKEDIRLIMCEFIWLIGKDEFRKIVHYGVK